MSNGGDGAAAPPIGRNVYCTVHPSIQIKRRKRNGEWLQLMKECPLCRADDDDDSGWSSIGRVVPSRSSSSRTSPGEQRRHKRIRQTPSSGFERHKNDDELPQSCTEVEDQRMAEVDNNCAEDQSMGETNDPACPGLNKGRDSSAAVPTTEPSFRPSTEELLVQRRREKREKIRELGRRWLSVSLRRQNSDAAKGMRRTGCNLSNASNDMVAATEEQELAANEKLTNPFHSNHTKYSMSSMTSNEAPVERSAEEEHGGRLEYGPLEISQVVPFNQFNTDAKPTNPFHTNTTNSDAATSCRGNDSFRSEATQYLGCNTSMDSHHMVSATKEQEVKFNANGKQANPFRSNSTKYTSRMTNNGANPVEITVGENERRLESSPLETSQAPFSQFHADAKLINPFHSNSTNNGANAIEQGWAECRRHAESNPLEASNDPFCSASGLGGVDSDDITVVTDNKSPHKISDMESIAESELEMESFSDPKSLHQSTRDLSWDDGSSGCKRREGGQKQCETDAVVGVNGRTRTSHPREVSFESMSGQLHSLSGQLRSLGVSYKRNRLRGNSKHPEKEDADAKDFVVEDVSDARGRAGDNETKKSAHPFHLSTSQSGEDGPSRVDRLSESVARSGSSAQTNPAPSFLNQGDTCPRRVSAYSTDNESRFKQCDSNGRCVRHPHMQLRKKRPPEGREKQRWKSVIGNCTECCFEEVRRLRAENLRKNERQRLASSSQIPGHGDDTSATESTSGSSFNSAESEPGTTFSCLSSLSAGTGDFSSTRSSSSVGSSEAGRSEPPKGILRNASVESSMKSDGASHSNVRSASNAGRGSGGQVVFAGRDHYIAPPGGLVAD